MNLYSEKITLTNRQPSHPISIVKLTVLRKLEFVGDITINGIRLMIYIHAVLRTIFDFLVNSTMI